MSLQAVILAAGEGTRLRPLTQNKPKALIPVANQPILEHVINSLTEAGIRDIIVVVGYRKEQVMRHLARLPVPVMVVHQKDQLGTAHALLCAKNLVADDVLVIPGDNYIDPASIRDIAAVKNSLLYATHRQPSNFGVVSIEDDTITKITEKPDRATRMTVSCGVYHLAHNLLDTITHLSLAETIDSLISAGVKMSAVKAHSWQDAIYPWDLLVMNERLLNQIQPKKSGRISSSVVIQGDALIGPGCRIGPGTIINGPAIIGEDCIIESHVVINPGSSIGSRVRIEPFSVISNSILMDDVAVASHCRISGAVIGEGSTIGEYSASICKSGYITLDNAPVRSSCGVIMGNGVYSGPSVIFENSIIGNDVVIDGRSDIRLSGAVIPDKTRVM